MKRASLSLSGYGTAKAYSLLCVPMQSWNEQTPRCSAHRNMGKLCAFNASHIISGDTPQCYLPTLLVYFPPRSVLGYL